MSKSPHTPKFRAKVSQEYLDGLGSYNYLSAKYRIYGIASFMPKSGNASYSSNFKTMCVEAVLAGTGSVDDIVAEYNISSRQVLRNWIMRYNANRELKPNSHKAYKQIHKKTHIHFLIIQKPLYLTSA